MASETITRVLESHPRLTGALLGAALLVTEVGSVLAGSSYPGP